MSLDSRELACQFCGVPFKVTRGNKAADSIARVYLDTYNIWEQHCHQPDVPDWINRISDELDRGEALDEWGEQQAVLNRDGCCRGTHYHEKAISRAEMSGSAVGQCLVPKSAVNDWQPERADQDFETTGSYFLTETSRNEGNWFFPGAVPRHGFTGIRVCNYNDHLVTGESYGIPFHPTCFRLFARASRHRLGYVDADSLFDWFSAQCTAELFHILRTRHVWANKKVFDRWHHNFHAEFFAANPEFVPAFTGGLRMTVSPGHREHVRGLPLRFLNHAGKIDYLKFRSGEFRMSEFKMDRDPIKHYVKPQGTKLDVFERLPNEILHLIMDHLSSRDLANLRRVSRAAEHVPATMFRRLLQNEFPWFWEVDTQPQNLDWPDCYIRFKFIWNRQYSKGLINRKKIWDDVNKLIDHVEGYRHGTQAE